MQRILVTGALVAVAGVALAAFRSGAIAGADAEVPIPPLACGEAAARTVDVAPLAGSRTPEAALARVAGRLRVPPAAMRVTRLSMRAARAVFPDATRARLVVELSRAAGAWRAVTLVGCADLLEAP